MPRITFIEHNGKSHIVEAVIGTSIMQVAVDNLIPGIIGDCGGCCSCATCHSYVPSEWLDKLPPKKPDEEMMLEGALDVTPNSRLTCQIKVTDDIDGLVVEMPASQF